jgi:dCMP deaminase
MALCTICHVELRLDDGSEFCSYECWLNSKPIYKECEICSSQFIVLKCFSDRKICNNCSNKKRDIEYSHTSQHNELELTEISCAACGANLNIDLKRLEKGGYKCCSTICVKEITRRFNQSHNDQNSGTFIFNKAGEQQFKSSWELKRMKEIDSDHAVIAWNRSKRIIPWIDAEGVLHNYSPDFEIYYDNGAVIIEEIKGLIDDIAQRKTEAGKTYAKKEGLIYRVISATDELQPVEYLSESYDNDYGVFYRPVLEYVFMSLANQLALRSTCLRNHVGAVITDREMTNVLCLGYNGGEKGGHNQCDSLEPGKCNCVHAEINAIAKATTTLKGCTIFSTVAPCVVCSKVLINRGIERIIYLKQYRSSQGLKLLRIAGIEVQSYADFCEFSDRKIARGLLA